MDYAERLISAGIRPDCALETVAWYEQQGDEGKLEEYVKECEGRAVKCMG